MADQLLCELRETVAGLRADRDDLVKAEAIPIAAVQLFHLQDDGDFDEVFAPHGYLARNRIGGTSSVMMVTSGVVNRRLEMSSWTWMAMPQL